MYLENKRTFTKKCVTFFVLLLLYISVSAFSYASNVSNNLANSVLRLHIIANSDSVEDQELKYKIRDKVIEYMKTITCGIASKSEAISIAKEHIDDFKLIAKEVIANNGYNYNVNVNIGNFPFPTKQYGDISFPAGFYDAIKIELGEANGKNWWCVMFPPLCFVDVTSGIVPNESKEIIESSLSSEEYAIISQNNSEITFKFKLLEFFGNVASTFTAKK